MKNQKPKSKKATLGDFVTAELVGEDPIRQGVFVKDNGDGTILVEGKFMTWLCKGPDGVLIVPDETLFFFTRSFVARVRKRLGLKPSFGKQER